MSVRIIAEAGVNHDGSAETALRLVDVAAACGADIIKFQTFRAAELAGAGTPKAAYQKQATDVQEDQLAMLRRLELDDDAHLRLMARCHDKRIGFLSTPFDLPSLRFLVDELDVPLLKLSSGALTDGPLLLAAARSRRPLILSTGMGTLDDIERALGVLAFGYGDSNAPPSPAGFAAALATAEGRQRLVDKVTLLQCTTDYPARAEDANLRAMATMSQVFGLPVGLSDHTDGTAVALAATALGATVIEKHFTLDRRLPGPDHAASLEPTDLAALVNGVRDIERALGDGIKRPSPAEARNAPVVRKSLVATLPVRRGELFTAENLGCRRPGGGISPMEYWAWLGQPASRDFAAGEAISRD